MKIEDLNNDQLAQLAKTVARQRDYLGRVRDRMRSLRFSHTDRLYEAVERAHAVASGQSA